MDDGAPLITLESSFSLEDDSGTDRIQTELYLALLDPKGGQAQQGKEINEKHSSPKGCLGGCLHSVACCQLGSLTTGLTLKQIGRAHV